MIQITESATNAILKIMVKANLDTKTFAFDIGMQDGLMGFGFTKDLNGVVENHNGLTINVDPRILYGKNLSIDFGDLNGKQGFLFGEKNAN